MNRRRGGAAAGIARGTFSPSDVLSYVLPRELRSRIFDFGTTRDACQLRLVSREARAVIAEHAWHDGALIVGPLTSFRTSFPNATAANLSASTTIDDIGALVGIQKVRVVLCGSDYQPASELDVTLNPMALARLETAAQLVVGGKYVISPASVEALIRAGCDVRVEHSSGESGTSNCSGIYNELAAISAALDSEAPLAQAAGDAAAVSAAARSVLAAGPAVLPSAMHIDHAFRDTDCSASIASLLRDPTGTQPPRVLVAACRAAGLQLSSVGGTAAFLLVGGPAVLSLLLRRPEPAVVVAACEALNVMDPYYESTEAFTTTMAEEGERGGSGGSASLCHLLGGGLGCIDDVLISGSRIVPSDDSESNGGLAAFINAGGLKVLLTRVSTAEASADCRALQAVCGAIKRCAVQDRPMAVSIVTLGGIELLVGILRRGLRSGLGGPGSYGPPFFSAARAIAVCETLTGFMQPPLRGMGYPPTIAGVSERFLAAGGHNALAALLDVRGAAGLSRRRNEVVNAACGVLEYVVMTPRGKAAFFGAGGVALVVAALAWFSAGAIPFEERMGALIAVGKQIGVVCPDSVGAA